MPIDKKQREKNTENKENEIAAKGYKSGMFERGRKPQRGGQASGIYEDNQHDGSGDDSEASLKLFGRKNYGSGHDMKHHGEGKPYGGK